MVISILCSCCTYYRSPSVPHTKLPNDGSLDDSEPQRLSDERTLLDKELYRIARVAQDIIPSVVGISTFTVVGESIFEGAEAIEGVGSGVIVHESGYILTNDHVVGGKPNDITVIFADGSELEGETLWSDPTLDLAVVKVDGQSLPAAQLGDSDRLIVGEPAIAIGTPLGLQFQHTVTSGIISALNRTIEIPTELGENFMEDLIQTDASINLGNSGGPLIDIEGNVVGINTVKISSAEGIGFAIPIDVAKPIIRHFIEEGSFVTPYIGVVGFDREIAKFRNRRKAIDRGVYVIDIDERGPAFKAGIRRDDIITRIENADVTNMLGLRKAMYEYKVGDIIRIEVLREDEKHIFYVELEKKPV